MIKWILFILTVLCIACKHEPDLSPPVPAIQINIQTGDSVWLNINEDRAVSTMHLEPEIGQLKGRFWYIAPSSVLKDSTMVELRLTDNNRVVARINVTKSTINDTVISFKSIVMPLITGNCNFKACHGNGSKAGGVSLIHYDSVMKYVVRYQPGKGLFYSSLIKTDPLRRMPPAGPLHENKIVAIKKWIEQGALHN
jgi:hypothetical protein